jgi:hypothetical protein
MLIQFGKHWGKSLEHVLLRDPDYVLWMLKQKEPSGPLARALREARRLIAVFDAKPVVRKCRGTGCRKPATRCSLYPANPRPLWWCDGCDPYQLGASPGTLLVVKSYLDAITYVQSYCHGRKGDLSLIIKLIAEAKGLPSRVGDEEAEAFFCCTAVEGDSRVQPSAAGDRHPPDTFQASFCE